MKKGAGIAVSALVVGVIALLTFGVIFLINQNAANEIKSASERSKIEFWVNSKADIKTSSFTSDYPETDTLYREPIKITKESQFKVDSKTGVSPASELIVNAMYDCWSAFGSGKIDFLKYSKLGAKPFCFSCAQIVFSDEFKNATKPYVIQDYGYYLTYGHPATSSKSFIELIYNLKDNQLEKQELIIKEDLRIIFIATTSTSGKTATQFLENIDSLSYSKYMIGGIPALIIKTAAANQYTIQLLSEKEMRIICTG